MHSLECEIGLAHNLRLIREHELAIFHDDSTIDDVRAYATAICRVGQVRQHVSCITWQQWREHRGQGVDDDDIRLLARGELTAIVAQCLRSITSRHPDDLLRRLKAGINAIGPVNDRCELHHLEEVTAVIALGSVMAEPYIEACRQHFRKSRDAIAEFRIRAGVV